MKKIIFLLFIYSFCTPIYAQDNIWNNEKLFVGKFINNKVYFSLPLKNKFFDKLTNDEDKYKVWDIFFKECLGENYTYHIQFDATHPYMGAMIDSKIINKKKLNEYSKFKLGTKFKFMGSEVYGDAVLENYQFSYSEPGGAAYFLGELKPINFQTKQAKDDKTVLISLDNLFKLKEHVPYNIKDDESLKIVNKLKDQKEIEKTVIIKGPFREAGKIDYIVYFQYKSDMGERWKTIAIDINLENINEIAKEQYLHVIPKEVVDFNGDGVYEIILYLEGYEGSSFGVMYHSKTDKKFYILYGDYYGA